MSITPSFIANVGGAGNGKGLEATEPKPAPIARQGLSTPNNSGVVTVLPVWPPHTTVGRDWEGHNIVTERRLQAERRAAGTAPEPTR